MKHFKELFFFITILLACSNCFAQIAKNADYDKFIRSFRMANPHPAELLRSCTPTVCLMKIEVDSAKNIKDIRLSDSADSLLIASFDKHKTQINVKSLEQYLKTEFSKSNINTYIIPIIYGFHKMPCTPEGVKLDFLNQYFRFGKSQLIGNATFLDPIYTYSYVQK